MNYHHISVLADETIEYLNLRADGIYLDGTLGGAGHSERILRQLDQGLLIAMDLDETALNYSLQKLKAIGGNFVLAKGNFSNADLLAKELEVEALDGALLDLGVSSHQLDETERGFSYHNESRLDMRMDRDAKLSAYEIVNQYSEDEIERILREFGEERWSRRIAQFIVELRPIETTGELVEVIKKAVPAGARDQKHPARRTFQALRIAVNEELDHLESSLEKIVRMLKPGGRLAVITFHSLEDRIVKNTFRNMEKDCICPPGMPICNCDHPSLGKVITKKPIIPSYKELEFNPRSRSSKLRVFERL